ncbi:MAG: helicase-exonuclease AddAB subunit AddB, partial [Lachnospiraceae bacterium]|nr:helicase-exonuclease AddAB subunit AddB [Lachnospiraceae bacterium]
MAVQFITGSSGSGKTFVLYQKIIEESMQHPEGRYYVIVPEQFTMSTQKRLVMLHPRHAIMNIDILSFNRLAYRVFEELGYNTKSVLDDTGKNLVLRRIASLQEDHLSILKNKMKRPGYVDQVKSFISELEQYHILPEDLNAMGETAGMPPLFSKKAKEISLLYKSFLDYIRSDYITAEQVLSLLMDVIDKSEKVKDSVMVFDGFTGFTPLQNEVIQRLMPMTKKMVFTVTIDEKEPLLGAYAESDLFAMSKKMTAKLTDMAHMTHTEILEPLRLSMGEHSRFSNAKALGFMEAHLFRNDKAEFLEPDREEIAVYRLNDPREELAFCANRIRALCAKEGYRYGDMAIVCGDLNTYKNYFEEVFLQYDIPVFTDASLELSYQPAIEFIFSFLDVLSRNFSYESMLHFLRTGLTGLTTEQVDLFDSYLYRSGIRGFEKYAHIFTVRPSEFEEEELSQINEIRSMLYEAFAPVTGIFKKDSTVFEKSEGLLRIMEHFSVEEKCTHAAEEYIENKEQVKAQEYGQIYTMIADLLDKMGSILGEEQ